MFVTNHTTLSFLFFSILTTALVTSQSYDNPIIGLYPGTSSIPSKFKSNITIAFYFPYKAFWNITDNNVYANCNFCSWMRQMDSGAEFAVSKINNDPSVLPDTIVNILRVQSWDWNSGPGDGVGGMAVSTIVVGEQFPDVIGTVGDTADLSAMITAGVMSQFKIPFCGGVQNLPALSDRNNYPYYFRPTFSNRYGQDFVTLLKLWNVKRVALVFDTDDIESKGACLDIRNALFSSGVIILSFRHYHGLKTEDYSDIINEFKRVDARYMFICAQAWSNSYYFAKQAMDMGMITPTHVWFATQPPYPPDYSGAGVDSRLDIIVGMIYPAPYAEPQSDPNLISLNAQWKALYTQDPMKYQVDHFTWTNAGSYDCVGTLLSGFDQLLRNNPGFSVGMLAARRLQDRLSFETFRNTGFNGTLLNPVVLDDHGDIAANTMFTSLNETFWINGGSQPSFAEINKRNGALISHFPPTFYGGGSIPPPDGPINLIIPIHNSISEPTGAGILAMLVFGYTTTLGSIFFITCNQSLRQVRILNMPYTLISLLGSLTSLTSLLFFINDPSLTQCYLRLWLPLLGFTLTTTPLISKTFYVYKVCSASTSLNKQAVKRLKYATVSFYVVCFFVEVVILACWTGGGVKPVPRQVTFHEFTVMTCSPVKGSEAVAMYAFNSLILVALLSVAVMTRNISPEYSETSFLVLLAFGLLLVALLIIGLDADSHVVIKQAVCLWAASLLVPVLLVGPVMLEVLKESSLSNLKFTRLTSFVGGAGSGNEKSRHGANSITDSRNEGKQRQSVKRLDPRQSLTVTVQSPSNAPKSSYKRTYMKAKCAYKVKFGNLSFWSHFTMINGVSVCSLHKKVWIFCQSKSLEVAAFRILDDTTIESTGTIVMMKTPGQKAHGRVKSFSGYTIQAEFDEVGAANEFVKYLGMELSSIRETKQDATVVKSQLGL